MIFDFSTLFVQVLNSTNILSPTKGFVNTFFQFFQRILAIFTFECYFWVFGTKKVAKNKKSQGDNINDNVEKPTDVSSTYEQNELVKHALEKSRRLEAERANKSRLHVNW